MSQIPEVTVTSMADLAKFDCSFCIESDTQIFFTSTAGEIERWRNDTGKFGCKRLSGVFITNDNEFSVARVKLDLMLNQF